MDVTENLHWYIYVNSNPSSFGWRTAFISFYNLLTCVTWTMSNSCITRLWRCTECDANSTSLSQVINKRALKGDRRNIPSHARLNQHTVPPLCSVENITSVSLPGSAQRRPTISSDRQSHNGTPLCADCNHWQSALQSCYFPPTHTVLFTSRRC